MIRDSWHWSHKAIVRRSEGEGPDRLPDSLHPVLRRVLRARGVTRPEDLSRSLAELHDFRTLTGVDAAVELLRAALEQQQRILIAADFDADGATSCAVAVRALRRMGAAEVGFIVPNRFAFGYGLSPELVAVAAQSRPDLIVTVDNGISSVEGVDAARRRGIRVLVTDHHLPGEVLPAADAIVNPNLRGDPFPSKHLAGVGVVFYVLMALRARLREQGWFRRKRLPEPNLAELLDLVALGTVADLVRLDRNNRILVSQGLARIRAGACCPGISALAEAAGRPTSELISQDLAFAVAPRLNAAGRLEDMSKGIACLLADEVAEAAATAHSLDSLNRERRSIEDTMHRQALDGLAERLAADSNLPFGLCLYDDDWHQGVIGILAARIRERFHRPVVALASGGGDELKGSARSVPGLHLRDTLAAIDSRHPGLMQRFGGHAAAAGLSLKRPNLERFAAAFDAQVRATMQPEDLTGTVYSDGELSPDELCLETAQALRDAGPWGQGFPEPVFDGEFDVAAARLVAERHLKLRVRPVGGNGSLAAIAFRTGAVPFVEAGARLRVAYRLDVDRFQGMLTPQLVVEHLQLV